MNETAVTINTEEGILAGTYSVPEGIGPFRGALLIAGSGPLDRDGNHKRISLNLSKDLALLLDEAGWATLRFDKRGVGESTGDYMSTGFFDEFDDVSAALDWLEARPETDGAVPFGHSSGSLFASELAVRSNVMGAALLAYTIKTGEQTLVWQLGAVGDSVPGWIKSLLKVFGTSIEKQQAKALSKIKRTTDDTVRLQGQKVNAKWMREFMAYDPDPVLKSSTVPIFAITGSKDVQVDPGDIESVVEITGGRGTAVVIDDVDHILRTELNPVSNPKHYKKQVAKPIDPGVVTALTSWLSGFARSESGESDEL